MERLALLLAVFAILAVLLFLSRRQARSERVGTTDYERRHLFSKAERSFLVVLDQAIGARARTFGKVRLDQLLQVPAVAAEARRRAAQNGITRHQVDFVLCDPADLSVLAVVELDDANHGGDRTKGRDASVDEALASAGIPVIRFAARSGYAVDDVRKRLDAVLPAVPKAAPSARRTKSGSGKAGRPRERADAPAPAMPATEAHTTPDTAPASGSDAASIAARAAATLSPYARLGSCPSCGRPMVERIGKLGAQKGMPFLVCSGDPPCGTVVAEG